MEDDIVNEFEVNTMSKNKKENSYDRRGLGGAVVGATVVVVGMGVVVVVVVG